MSQMGWFRLHREIFSSDIWNDVTTFRLFLFIIGNASHKDGLKHKGMTLTKGQFVRSYRKLSDDLAQKAGRGYKKLPISSISNSINKLIEAERLNVTDTEHGTLFTVVNYASYQGLGNAEKETLNGSNEEVRTNNERSMNEVRTKTEQEQELKNLRIKELCSSGSSDAQFADVMKFYQENLQRGVSETPFNLELLVQFFDEWGHELLLAAMKVAAKAEAKGVRMLEGILSNWEEAGVKTIEDARQYQKHFNKGSSKQYKNNVVQIPDYNFRKDDLNASGDESNSKEFGDVRLFK